MPWSNRNDMYELSKPEVITSLEYDYVVCAVMEQCQTEEMKKQLIHYGVKKEQILWMSPEQKIFFKSFLFRKNNKQ